MKLEPAIYEYTQDNLRVFMTIRPIYGIYDNYHVEIQKICRDYAKTIRPYVFISKDKKAALKAYEQFKQHILEGSVLA